MRLIPFKYCADADRAAQPVGAQNFWVKVDGGYTRLYFDGPVGWASVEGEEVYVDGFVLGLDLYGSGFVKVALCGLVDVEVSLTPVDVRSEGLCYLRGVPSGVRRAAYQHHGEFPTVAALLEAGYVTDPVHCHSYGHAVHVVPGEGRLQDVVCEPSALVGGLHEGHVYEEYRKLKRSLVQAKDDELLVYLYSMDPVWEPVRLLSSRVLDVPVVNRFVNMQHEAVVRLDSYATSAVMLPLGTRLRHNGVVYGGYGVRVYAVFRGQVDFEVLPTDGRYKDGDPSVPLTYISSRDTHLTEHFEECLSARSTFARFIRETEASVVLSLPDIDQDGEFVEPQVVQVDDPLDEWRAVDVVRLEASNAVTGDKFWVRSFDWVAMHTLRASCSVCANIGGLVCIKPGGGAVIACGDHVVQVVFGAGSKNLEKWSLRLSRCYDEYAMDRGGPSGSEFSDAL